VIDLDFDGMTVLVVGGSSGIGNGIAHAFQERGAVTHVWGTRPRPEDYVEEGSDLARLAYAAVDVSDGEAIGAAAAMIPTLDVLVLAQGTVIYGGGENRMDGFRRVIEVNQTSVMACAMAFYDKLARTRASVIVISSTSAFQPARGNPAYSASKAGVVGLTRALASAWARDGIRVNSVAPGLVDTKLTAVTTKNPKRLAATLARIPLRRLGTPKDMAGAVLFLASPLAAYVIGVTIPVDGGLLLA